MKIKTADLIDHSLDWAVAKCLGATPVAVRKNYSKGWFLYAHSNATIPLEYSTNWSQGGLIIEREKLELRCNDYEWQAFCFGFPVSRAHSGTRTWAAGPTPLIAAMRCFCCTKLGDEVDVPDELV